ncbi:uncharacterized protein BDW47DRAFT_108946 [Aspergillus candidus]|uniref:Uncharacterized protein n=1 Tax=Aspergillus candidus TaxID=41067 RepID=A0A2I2F6E9_ASPCN|nr:hypothetical protein BDW47DRAFT_108946 [Aspergillus candidus]PLB36203.1 hypothetical protein BDW47DRAFT_108946 [Aspergillus candidus]
MLAGYYHPIKRPGDCVALEHMICVSLCWMIFFYSLVQDTLSVAANRPLNEVNMGIPTANLPRKRPTDEAITLLIPSQAISAADSEPGNPTADFRDCSDCSQWSDESKVVEISQKAADAIVNFSTHEREVNHLEDELEEHYEKTNHLMAQIEQQVLDCKLLEKQFAEIRAVIPRH